MLDHFLHVIQTGYEKYPNPYHNHCHAAEVLQTVHYMLMKQDAVVSHNSSIHSPLYVVALMSNLRRAQCNSNNR